MKNNKDENLENLEEKLKKEFEEKKRKKPMKITGASVLDIQRIQEKKVEHDQETTN